MKTYEEIRTLLENSVALNGFVFLEKIAKDIKEEQKHACEVLVKTKNGYDSHYVYNIPIAFDIETTNDQKTETAYMYHWQLCFNGYVTTGRTWDEFFWLLENIKKLYSVSSYIRMKIYIHNLAYESSFLLSRLKIEKLFAVDKRQPIYYVTEDGLEFYDSLILSGLSLETTAKNLAVFKLRKMTGGLDYRIPRNSVTPLTKKELDYCIADVTTLCAYIWEQINEYGEITKIPLTNTGKVRDYMREHCLYKNGERTRKKVRNKAYIDKIHELTLRPEEYLDLRKAFMGGFTHAGHLHVGEVNENVQSMDFSSSYPARMCEYMYPMSKGELVYYKDMSEYKRDIKRGYLCVLLCDMYDLNDEKFGFEHYISSSKCIIKEGAIEDNGRIVSADHIVIWMTSPDLVICTKCYKFKIRILRAWRYKAGYLPAEYVKCVLHFYDQKTILKGIDDKKAEYQKFKGMNNGIYGMSVTDIVHDDIVYDPAEESEPWQVQAADLDESIHRYNKNKNRFDFYVWGIFVTAWARYDLWKGIFELREDYLYSDTDSVKFINPEQHTKFFKVCNDGIRRRIKKEEERNGITYHIPKTIKGIEKPLGEWDDDGRYAKFKTLGAKRYMYEEQGELHITIAGISKKKGCNYIAKQNDPWSFFSNGMMIPAECSGKTIAKYRDIPCEAVITDRYGISVKMNENSCVYITESDYTMSMSKNFLKYIEDGHIDGVRIEKFLR